MTLRSTIGKTAGRMFFFAALLCATGALAGEFERDRQSAEAGDLVAAYNLAVAYRDGIGTAVDGQQAIAWFEKAAGGGDATAAFNLGVIFDDGGLVGEDDARAAAWYRLAAERGSVDAMINLGLMLEAGEGMAQDLTAAAGYFRKAAERGDSFGRLKLGLMQQGGIGIVRNVEEAVNSLLAAFEQRDVDLEVILRDTPEALRADARLAIKRVLAARRLIDGAGDAEIDPVTLGAIEKHYAAQ